MKLIKIIFVLALILKGLNTINVIELIPEAQAGQKTYYDQNTGSFKSVNTSSGQTFDYGTGQYGQDYSR